MDHWTQSQVILSLLEQPLVWPEWNRILAIKEECNPSFSWSPEFTGRAEGYPDIDCAPQLQDLLEFFTPDQDAATLARLAYEIGHLKETTPVTQHSLYIPGSEPHLHGGMDDRILGNAVANTAPSRRTPSQTSSSTPTDKELPPIPSSQSFLAKRNHAHTTPLTHSLQYPAATFVSWHRLEDSIVPDEVLPSGSNFEVYSTDFHPSESHFDPNHYNF
jgi:hypothetical protein